MVTDLQSRINRALSLRSEGYNCAQCVAMVFDDVTGQPAELLARVTAGLGSGVAGLQEVCGAVTAMAVVEGLISFKEPQDKKRVYDTVRGYSEQFRHINCGIVCHELKHPGAKPCPYLIVDAVTILHNALNADA